MILYIIYYQKVGKGFSINKFQKLRNSKGFQTFVFFSIFRAVYGFLVVIFIYYFGYKSNAGIATYVIYLLISAFLSRVIFKKLKNKFNL